MGFNIRNFGAVVNYNTAKIKIPPRQRLYRFPEDIWVTSDPRQLEEGQNMIKYNSTNEMLVISVTTAFLSSYHKGEVVYRTAWSRICFKRLLVGVQQPGTSRKTWGGLYQHNILHIQSMNLRI